MQPVKWVNTFKKVNVSCKNLKFRDTLMYLNFYHKMQTTDKAQDQKGKTGLC